MLLVAHRTPDTGPACADLAAAGAGAFELDVQLRGDRVVVSHFLPFLRIHGWLEHDGGRFRWRGGPPADAGVEEVVALVPAGRLVLLDPKESRPRRRARLVEALAEQLPDRDRFRVSTDDPADLARYRAAGFATWRTVKTAEQLAVLCAEPAPADVGASVRHTLLTAASLAALHRVVGTVAAWTVNDVDRARALRDLGVGALTTDRIRDLAPLVRPGAAG